MQSVMQSVMKSVMRSGLRSGLQSVLAVSLLAAIPFAMPATAQVAGVDLNGRYQCVLNCLGVPGSFAYVTQNGWELNMVNDAGQPSRAWVNYPGRLWVDRLQEGAIYSPDGMTIQFDHGTIWQRAVEVPAPPPPPPRRRK
jgi:hypothetical protein